MEDKLSWTGAGPKIALATLPYIILSIVVTTIDPGFLKVDFMSIKIFKITGFSWLAIGIVFYVASARTFLREFKKGKLITTGPFALCRNPIYGAFIVFVLPSLALIFRSGMIMTIDVVLYLNFKILIGEEYRQLKSMFKEEYDRYEQEVNELLPFPGLKRKTIHHK
jgi:protein-S-isoprenylcysteine O-methyltransferase Ste14